MTNTTNDEGWGWPLLAKKPHFFVKGVSLCRRWMFMGLLSDDLEPRSLDCVACTKKLASRGATRS